jgi:hypothetical protein
MLHRKDYLDDLAKAKLAKAAYELGLEVGEHGHLDTVGWVGAELRHIVQQAEELKVADIIKRRYEFGKEKGHVRRQGKYNQSSAAHRVKALGGGGAQPVAENLQQVKHDDRFAERVSAEEGIWSTISVVKYARGNEELQSHLSNLIASMGDLHDRIMQLPPGRTPDRTFDSALGMITEVGWLSSYDVKFFDERSAMASVDTTSMFARSFEKCESPMCLPLGNVMETVGLKTFGRQILAVEEKCMAQGHDHCTFKLFPREVPREIGI